MAGPYDNHSYVSPIHGQYNLTASAAVTSSGSSAPIALPPGTRELRCLVKVSAASGTIGTYTVVLEDSVDGVNWFQLQTPVSLAAGAGNYALTFAGAVANQIRITWAVSGGTSPSLTWSSDLIVR